ncbi:MAG: cytochrome c biogenesis protein CcsA [Bacteroidota bacterium]
MERISRALFSMRMMATAMIIFAIAIGAATLIESSYDTHTAKVLIYNALWFEILLVYLGINLIANMFRYQMFQRQKIAMLMFHLSFIVILIGSAITRYVSFEGMMLIREGSQSDFIYSSDPHFSFRIHDEKLQYTYSEKKYMSQVHPFGININKFSIPVEFPNHKTPILIEFVDYRKNLVDTVIVNDSIQGTMLEVMTNGMQANHLEPNGSIMIGDIPLFFEKTDESKLMPGIHLQRKGAAVMMRSDMPVRYLPMAEMTKYRQSGTTPPDSIFVQVPADSTVQFMTTTLYQVENEQFVFKQVLNHAKRMKLPSGRKDLGSDYLTLKITDGTTSKIVELEGGANVIPEQLVFDLNGLTYEMTYGATKFFLPFSISCRDFALERYAGSEAPSSFASEVTINDTINNYTRNQRIYMNNVMDYQGYRFFQSAYDPDEKGTRLSVNHDWLGTNVSYLGYLLMSMGMIFSLFAPAGRFKDLNDLLKKSNEKRKKMMLIGLLMLAVFPLNAQEHNHADGHDHSHESNHEQVAPAKKAIHREMSKEHSEELASLLVLAFDGRVTPFHTVCDQIMNKVYRANKFEGNNAVQTVMSMHMYPEYWLDQKIINVPANLRDTLHLKDYATYREMADEGGQFKWMEMYRKAHQKQESKRDEFDKKLIKLVDRFQVIQAVLGWQYMQIIPVKKAPNNKWYVPLGSELMELDPNASGYALKYITALDKACETGKYGEASDLLKDLKKYQRKEGAKVVPAESAVKLEISYNKMNIFKNAYRSYLLLGLVMLILFITQIIANRSTSKVYLWIRRILVGLVVVFFVYHGAGLVMRWMISGHAPWSNGYEALIFIAWVTVGAGFIFSRKNPIILPGAVILASLMIMVTELELMDPEITPLQPVLKSYWLKVHVAIITGSYAFLGLGAILGLMNLVLYILRSKRNGKIVSLNINELTYVSEMTITIGLFMLTIGTFLGGIWANESWGRYWGWDPKETWALVSVLVYAIVLHLRYIPALRGKFVFNVVSFWAYSAILFTFFGVNFYLVGLHSYAQGDGLGEFPTWLIMLTLGFVAFTLLAYFRHRNYSKNTLED